MHILFIHNYLIIIIGVEFFKRSFANRVEAGDEALYVALIY